MPHFVNIHELQSKASTVIQNLTGAEAGFISASAAAGLSMSIAGAMTGLNPAHAEQLPLTPGSRHNVPVQMGHLCHYGAAIEQAISLTGATCIAVGQSTQVLDHQLEAALDEITAAAVYVVSHHVVEYGQIPLGRFCEICHRVVGPGGGAHRRVAGAGSRLMSGKSPTPQVIGGQQFCPQPCPWRSKHPTMSSKILLGNDLNMLRGGGCGKPGDNTLWMELNRCFVVGWAFLLICCAS